MIEVLKKLDFEFWVDKNPYYGDRKLNSSMLTAQKMMQNKGLNYNYEKCNELINAIYNTIDKYKRKKDNNSAINAFDLIQMWGGQMGRQPYARGGVRFNQKEWLPFYVSFIDLLKSQDLELSLKEIKKIKGIGTSFATKHLRFWDEKPILDTRILALLYCGQEIEYSTFLSDVCLLADDRNLKILEIEQALFAFSENYFLNKKQLQFKEQIKEWHDYVIAKKLHQNSGHKDLNS